MYFYSEKDIKISLKEQSLSKIWAYIKKVIRPSIQINYFERYDERLKIGSSKLGGKPDLPEHISWPKFNNHYQSFFAQINLKEVKDFDSEELLPKKGILYFFYDLFCFDQENEDGNGGCVIYYPDAKNLFRREPPKDIYLKDEPNFVPRLIYRSSFVSFFSALTIPYINHKFIDGLKEKELLSEDEIFYKYFEKLFDSEEIDHRLLGYSENVQDEMESECYLIEKNLGWNDLTDKNRKELKKQWKDWILLFQFPYIPELNIEIQDGGTLYYWIHKNDLKKLRFDKVKVIMQSH